MNKFISADKSQKEDKTGSEDGGGEGKKVREDFLDAVTFEQSHE